MRYLTIFFLSAMSISLIAQNQQDILFPEIPVMGYGDVTYTLNATANSGLTVRYQSSDATVATVTGNIVTIKKTGFTFIRAFQDGGGTYKAAEPAVQLLVVCPKATLTVTATDKSIDAGTATPAFTYSISGYKKSETSSVVSGIPTFQSLASFLSSGTYPIVINKGTLAATNYDFQLIDGKLTVVSGTSTPVVNANDSLVRIFPNPATDYLYISFENTFDLTIFDIHGKEIIRLKDVKNSVSLPITHLKAGFYFVKIFSGSLLGVHKVLINR